MGSTLPDSEKLSGGRFKVVRHAETPDPRFVTAEDTCITAYSGLF